MAQRRSQQLPLIFLVLIILGVLLVRYLRRTPPPPQFTCGVHCGTERWRIKTVFDGEAGRINFTPRNTTVSELVAMRAPSRLEEEERSDAEKQVYSVEAVLLGWKQETGAHGDHDFHLVLADPNDLTRTMIAEVPAAECEGACSSSQAQKFAEVRQTLIAQLAQPEAHFRRFTPAWVVRVEGVGFFDIFHQQIGVAENCMELHPLLKVEFVREVGPDVLLPRRIEPPAEHRCGHIDHSD
ncbi:MAG TPA: hypothetical protein VFR84_12545 [Candidatus Angelobacter sp.]|nr:hypothetical protein [Candidatus Angelobacter sp.]